MFVPTTMGTCWGAALLPAAASCRSEQQELVGRLLPGANRLRAALKLL